VGQLLFTTVKGKSKAVKQTESGTAMMVRVRQRLSCRKREGAMELPSTRRADEPPSGPATPQLLEDLRRLLRTELLRDPCSAATVARLFSMHRRTLNRHLRSEGFAFRQIANQVRYEIACDLLSNTDMALSQIAAVLKYSELSAFTRAFRRWSGQTPSVWRASRAPARKQRRLRRVIRPGRLRKLA
jgi:AraC-like DNA-binding protein